MLGILGKLGRRSRSGAVRSLSGSINSVSQPMAGTMRTIGRGGARPMTDAVNAAGGFATRAGSRMPGEYRPVVSQILGGKPGMGGSVPIESATQSAMDARRAQAVAARRRQNIADSRKARMSSRFRGSPASGTYTSGGVRDNIIASARAREASGYRASGVGREVSFGGGGSGVTPVTIGRRRGGTLPTTGAQLIDSRQVRQQQLNSAFGRGYGPPKPGPMSPLPQYGPPKPGPMSPLPRPAASGTGKTASKNVSAGNQPRRFRDMNPRTRRMLMIGGAAAVGVTAASNRRGQGTSSGRQSMTRY